MAPAEAEPLDPEFLALLVCPLSRKPLFQRGDRLVSTDPETRRCYRIEDGFPVLLVEESEELEVETWRAWMAEAGLEAGGEAQA